MTAVRTNAGIESLDVAFRWNGAEVRCRSGEALATALLCAGQLQLRGSPRAGTPRGVFCMMGVCQECMVRVDGAVRQACMTAAENGMRVERIDTEPAT